MNDGEGQALAYGGGGVFYRERGRFLSTRERFFNRSAGACPSRSLGYANDSPHICSSGAPAPETVQEQALLNYRRRRGSGA